MSATKARTDDEVLRDIGALAVTIRKTEATLKGYYATRAALFQEGRDRNPRITQARLAAAAGVSEAAVIRVLNVVNDD